MAQSNPPGATWGLFVAVAVPVVVLGALVWWTRGPPTPSAPGKPNVLLIVWDTVRADRMSVYGHDRPTTPRLEAFASEAAVFDQAWSPGIWTLASHASMFTGLPVESTGTDERWIWLDGQHTTLAEHFSANGYDTFALSANALVSSSSNFTQGFRVGTGTWKPLLRGRARQLMEAKLIPEDRSNELAPGWRAPDHGEVNAEFHHPDYKESAPLVANGLRKWLSMRPSRDQPWLAYLNMMEAHTPRIPSMAARKAVINDEALIRKGLEVDASHANLHFFGFGKHPYSAEELAAINAVYDATLRDLDDATADLLDALATQGVLDDTIVVITSDHGENLGDHGLFNHRYVLYETLLHVPLIIRYPKGMTAGRVDAPVSTMDVFATLCDLAEIDPPTTPFASRTLRTTERRPPVSFVSAPLRRELETVNEVYLDVDIEPWIRSGHATRDGATKLIRWLDGPSELYDVDADPGELANLAATHPDEVARLSTQLDALRASAPAYDPSLRGPEDSPTAVRASYDEVREHLEALGYVQDDAEAGP